MQTNKVYHNRYGDEYWFQQLDQCVYTICGNLEYWRYGGKPHQDEADCLDLGFADPSGGPFLEAGFEIDGRRVVKLMLLDGGLQFRVE